MAEKVLGSNVKCCATCGYFQGNRKAKMGGFVIIETEDGICYQTFKTGLPRKAMYGCASWQKWPPLIQ